MNAVLWLVICDKGMVMDNCNAKSISNYRLVQFVYRRKQLRKLLIRSVKTYNWLINYFDLRKINASGLPIDILIPVIPRDLQVLPLVVESARKYIRHPINMIYVISPHDDLIKDKCEELGLIYINEKDVIPEWVFGIDYTPKGQDRKGWIIQQLIKMSAFQISASNDVLILDADTVYIRDIIFHNMESYYLYYSGEYHQPYRDTYSQLTGLQARYYFSFVSHGMLFNREVMRKLQQLIEVKTGKKWLNAIIDNLPPEQGAGFSEYETYGNYLYYCTDKVVHIDYYQNLSLSRKKLAPLNALSSHYSKYYNSVSFHHYEHK